ncbi:hypothetical protein PHISCL_06838 [Aspergillus sclerotialis]|uniref:ER-bound oxygenase mpaB/mpaB'/Rubber oxygenase catalytic domain-containing protein n=1 Tax=Aspergillus sclerotialis TaxID=2070753 RepID=A0A3A2ZCC5_9EURO|nr:hypothetical protein PHISCL_06838 [Aspergillus sclerotialis]
MNEAKFDITVPSVEVNESATLEKNAPSDSDVPDAKLLDALDEPQQMRRVVREAILLAGGAVAILLQVADPGVAQGVDNHSNFDYRPMDRLRTTMTYVYCMVFGTREEKKAVISMVHRAHAPVKGEDYSADDPELQLWVASTLYAVGTDIHQRVFGQLSTTTADEIYREYAVLAVSLRVPPEMWPPSRKAFWEYWDSKIETLEITDHARSVAKDLLFNKKLPLYIRATMPLVRLSTIEMLPPRIRAGYGLKSTKTRRRMFGFSLSLTKATYPALPKVLRTYPMRYYMKDMRRRLNDMA